MNKSNLLLYNALIIVAVTFVFISCEDQEPNLQDTSNLVTGVEPPPESCEIGHRTQTPGGWGAPAAGNNAGSLRDLYFDSIFPDGLIVGCTEGFYVKLTSAAAVEAFLPSGGKPGAIEQNYTNPNNKELKNSLVSHAVALTLSLHFDHYLEDFGEAEYLLCDLRICSGKFVGKKTQAILNGVNNIIGGCDINLTVNEAHELVTNINENFIDGGIDNGYLCCPVVETLVESNPI